MNSNLSNYLDFRVETIKRQTGAVYWCMVAGLKSARASGLGCTLALAVSNSTSAAAMCGLQRCTSAVPFACTCVVSRSGVQIVPTSHPEYDDDDDNDLPSLAVFLGSSSSTETKSALKVTDLHHESDGDSEELETVNRQSSTAGLYSLKPILLAYLFFIS